MARPILTYMFPECCFSFHSFISKYVVFIYFTFFFLNHKITICLQNIVFLDWFLFLRTVCVRKELYTWSIIIPSSIQISQILDCLLWLLPQHVPANVKPYSFLIHKSIFSFSTKNICVYSEEYLFLTFYSLPCHFSSLSWLI